MNNSYIFIILGMMTVTYIPRLLPFLFVSNNKESGWFNRFLKYIPYTALGALIIPGVFSSIPEVPLAAIAGIAFSFIYSWFKKNVIVSVLGSVLISYSVILIAR